jgi:hypothetical protein
MTSQEEGVYMRAEGWIENWLEKELEANPDSDVVKQNLEQWKVLIEGIRRLKIENLNLQHTIAQARRILA